MGPHSTACASASPRLLDQLRERIRYLHYSLRTEQAYVHWVRAFIRFHQMRHPRGMGAAEVQAFLSWLSAGRNVSASTHRQALSAVLFLYQQVLGLQLPWMAELDRPQRKPRLPVVLTMDEVRRVLALLEGTHALLARLLYGTGLRITEALSRFASRKIRTVQKLLGHSDVSTTMIYTHVLDVAGGTVRSPLDVLATA